MLRATFQIRLIKMPFPFMQLPIELRLQIYEELLSSSTGLITLSSFGPARPIRCSFDPSILRASKTICAEALPILYGSNTFAMRVYNWEDLKRSYTVCMGSDNSTLIRRIQFEAHVEEMGEVAVKSSVESMGMDWERLQSLAVKFGIGLGAACGPEIGREQGWLAEVGSKKEVRLLGLRQWGPLKTVSWFVRRTEHANNSSA